MSSVKNSRKRRFDDIENDDSLNNGICMEPQSKRLKISHNIDNDYKNETEINELNQHQIKKKLNEINHNISESKCLNDLYPFLDIVPLNAIKQIIRSKVETLNGTEINKIYHSKCSINDVLREDALQSIFEFLNIPPKSVCKTWDQVSDIIKNNLLRADITPPCPFRENEIIIVDPSSDREKDFIFEDQDDNGKKNILAYPPIDNYDIYFGSDYKARHCLYKGAIPYTFEPHPAYHILMYDASIHGKVQFIGRGDNVICDSYVSVAEKSIVHFENIVFDYYRAKDEEPNDISIDTVIWIAKGAKVVIKNCTIKSGLFIPIYLSPGATITCLGCIFEGNYVDPEAQYHEHNRDRYGDVSLRWCVYDTYPILLR